MSRSVADLSRARLTEGKSEGFDLSGFLDYFILFYYI
jgi:hypothetical protein